MQTIIMVLCMLHYYIVYNVGNRSECAKIINVVILRAAFVYGTYFSMSKIAICCTLVYLASLENSFNIDTGTLFAIIGLYNVLRHDIGWMLPYSLQQISELTVTMTRIQVNLYANPVIDTIVTKVFFTR